MRDREAINRFAAFSLVGWEKYTSGDMDVFLAEGLKRLAKCSETERDALREKFDAAMTLNSKIFGRHAFRKSLVSEFPVARSVINISLFEVTSVVLASHMDRLSYHDTDLFRRIIVDLVEDEEFISAITYSTNSTQAVRRRFRLFEKALEFLT